MHDLAIKFLVTLCTGSKALSVKHLKSSKISRREKLVDDL